MPYKILESGEIEKKLSNKEKISNVCDPETEMVIDFSNV